MSNSHGNTDRDVRKWLRKMGVKPSLDNVEAIGREVRRTQNEDEAVERRARESGEAARIHAAKQAHYRRMVENEQRKRK